VTEFIQNQRARLAGARGDRRMVSEQLSAIYHDWTNNDELDEQTRHSDGVERRQKER